jgi:hypothetical protein
MNLGSAINISVAQNGDMSLMLARKFYRRRLLNRDGSALIWKILCAPLRLFAYFAVKELLKPLTAKSAQERKDHAKT